jgi:hypothetical protein
MIVERERSCNLPAREGFLSENRKVPGIKPHMEWMTDF